MTSEALDRDSVARTLGVERADGLRPARRLRRLSWAAGVVVLAVLGLAWSRAGHGSEAVQYKTLPAERGDLRVTVTATGTLEPTKKVDVGSEVSGTVVEVMVDEDDHVRAGQVLARIDPTKLEAQARQLEAALEAAEARLKQAGATREESRTQLGRLEQLHESTKGMTPSLQDLDSQRAVAKRAQADEASARASVSQARASLQALHPTAGRHGARRERPPAAGLGAAGRAARRAARRDRGDRRQAHRGGGRRRAARARADRRRRRAGVSAVDTPSPAPLVELREITRVYGTGDAEVRALGGVSLSIEAGEFVAIMGPSGSGKSTCMNVVGCLDTPSSGEYLFSGVDLARLDMRQRALFRRHYLGFVFQGFNLLSRTSALENVELPLLYRGVPSARRHARAREALASVGLDGREAHAPSELSGGQQQRVAIARAIVTDPVVLLADEPTGNLDRARSREILELLARLNRERGITVLIVTHDPEIAAYARRNVHFLDGLVSADERRPEAAA